MHFGSRKGKALTFVSLFAIVGSLAVIISTATGVPVGFEPELGTLMGSAKVVANAADSNGQAVQFAAVATPTPTSSPVPTATPNLVSSAKPCVAAAKPAQWKHVVVLLFENKTYSEVIGSASAPFISGLATKCGTYNGWRDANSKVTGASDGTYVSKPSYATYTSGVPPSVHGLTNDTYTTTSSVDNIFNRLRLANKTTKVYQSGTGSNCQSSNFSGAYHDPLRYYTNVGGQSSDNTTFCNTHDVPIANFMTDVTAGSLPAFSIILPTNQQNMHDNTVSSGDTWAKSFLTPLLDSAQYKSGDTAVFFLWDEDTPIPNVFLAPSITPGTKPVLAAGSYPYSHYSALRTCQEMLGLTPLLGNSGQAPSLLKFYNGE